MEQRECSIVGYEEEGVESAVAKYGCCCAYAGEVKSASRNTWGNWNLILEHSPLTKVPAFSNCPRKPCVVATVIDASAFGAILPACKRVLTRSNGLPIMIPAAPEM